MARQRLVKPEMRTSPTVCQWPLEVRLFWVYLLMYLDNHGRGEDDLSLVKADCFPRDRAVSERKVGLWLALIASTKVDEADEPPLCRYEVRGRRYLHAVNWTTHQKLSHPGKSAFPPCPVHDDLRNPSGNLPEAFHLNSEPVPNFIQISSPEIEREVEEEVEEEQPQTPTPTSAPPAPRKPKAFDAFWAAYPRRVGKQAAIRRWNDALKTGADPEAIIAGAQLYAAQVRQVETRLIKYPEGWLHAGRWEDEAPDEPMGRPAGWEFGMDAR